MANFSSMIQYNYQILASTRGVYLNTLPCVKENVPVTFLCTQGATGAPSISTNGHKRRGTRMSSVLEKKVP